MYSGATYKMLDAKKAAKGWLYPLCMEASGALPTFFKIAFIAIIASQIKPPQPSINTTAARPSSPEQEISQESAPTNIPKPTVTKTTRLI